MAKACRMEEADRHIGAESGTGAYGLLEIWVSFSGDARCRRGRESGLDFFCYTNGHDLGIKRKCNLFR